MKALSAYLFILQRAPESVARRKMLQSPTVLNFRALRQRTPAIQPIMYQCHELSLQRIELAITSVSSLLRNQLVASESQRARGHGQTAVVTTRVKLSFSFLSPFSIYSIICLKSVCRRSQNAVRISCSISSGDGSN